MHTTAGTTFGPFTLFISERLLERDGVPVAVGSRALDILIALVGQAGEIVSKRELVDQIWPDTTVDEGALRVHIAGLRKAMGDGVDGQRFIANIPGRGYCFVAPIGKSGAASAPPTAAAPPEVPRASTLPPVLARMIGRDKTVAEIVELVHQMRFVTIVGPGGMGKTSVAIAVGNKLRSAFADEVYFVDIGQVSDPDLVASSVAAALGIVVHAGDPVFAIVTALRGRRILVILDCCEHVIEAAAALAERLFAGCSDIHILATSREALRVDGEQVHLLGPLDAPPRGETLSAAHAMTFPAVQLLLERASASGNRFEMTDANAPVIADICQKLDGIALAIELAAGSMGTFGLQGVASLLDNRFRLLLQGRRTALPRHQTLSAMLDWSYNLLPQEERLILRRLSVFVGTFTLEAAQAIARDDAIDEHRTTDIVLNLVSKSLVSTKISDAATRFRLLDTTRAYAFAKLVEAEEAAVTQAVHCAYFRDVLDAAVAASLLPAGSGALAALSEHLGNIRSALRWSLESGADLENGARLAAGAAALFLELSLLAECSLWTERALAALSPAQIGSRTEMELRASFGVSLMFTKGNIVNAQAALTKSLALAQALDDPYQELRLLGGLNIFQIRLGDFREALVIAKQAKEVSLRVSDPAAGTIVDWMLGTAYHLLGDQVAAHAHCESVLGQHTLSQRINTIHLGFDHRIRALVALGRTLWLRGFPERASEVAHFTIKEAATLENPVSVCIGYIYTAAVFLWNADWETAEDVIEQLITHAQRHFLDPYHAVGLGLKGELAVRRGECAAGKVLLKTALTAMETERHHVLKTAAMIALAEGFAQSGEHRQALEVIDRTIAIVGETEQSVDMPEMLRLKAEFLQALGPGAEEEALSILEHALAVARQQSALGWELRVAMSLARLQLRRGGPSDAFLPLRSAYDRFTEGFERRDLVDAAQLLGSIET
ncbi:winged helix-turn-helix domain-containing protein [Rhizobium sp. BK251]|uniref:ATP-binding protein n=1 Tax=Rhizobium sp. BK251 TaxID=2512125 RepID=UPI001048B8CE|nr:winged helix-turn-helix domain-containing protein [Rhizobium sp. BK251]TCL72248.1 putative ATPase [Rhizobium sp. BK251]